MDSHFKNSNPSHAMKRVRPRRRRRFRTTTTSSPRSSSASRRVPPPSPAPAPSASAGSASSPNPNSSAASARTTTGPLPFSTASSSAKAGSTPTQSPPDRVPARRFSLDRWCGEPDAHHDWSIHCCRHGLVLCAKTTVEFVAVELLVVDPMTGDQSRVAISDQHNQDRLIAAAVVAGVVGADATAGLRRRRRQFILVALFANYHGTRMTASVYSSDSGVWSESVSTLSPPSSPVVPILQPSSLVGHGIYRFLSDGEIVRFDLGTQSLSLIIEQPPLLTEEDADHELIRTRLFWNNCTRWIMPAAGDDGRFCLAILSGVSITFWEREAAEVMGASGWVLCRTVELDKVLPVQLKNEHPLPYGIMGFDEENRVIFIWTEHDGVFMSDVESMQQFKKVSQTAYKGNVHPYSSF